jgi:polyhydroxyalkanoate synthesis regulator phasin
VEKAIRDLEPLVNDLLEAGADSSDMLIEILVSSMDSFPSTELFQSFCLKAIWKSCKATETCGSSNLHETVMKTMKSFPSSEKVQGYGCMIFFALAANSSNRVALVRSGSCPFLVEAMAKFTGNVSVVRNGIGALRNLSLDTEARETLNCLPTWKSIVRAMEHNTGDAAIQRDGCALLSNLAVDAEKKAVSGVSNEVLEAVVRALESHRGDVSVVTSACFALKNFTYEESNLRSLSRVQNIFKILQKAGKLTGNEEMDHIVERLQTSRAADESLEEQAQESLKAMIEVQPHRPSEMIATVMNVLRDYSWSAKIAVVCTQLLREHATKSDIHRRTILDAGTLEELKALDGAFGVRDAVKEEVLRLIAFLEDAQI